MIFFFFSKLSNIKLVPNLSNLNIAGNPLKDIESEATNDEFLRLCPQLRLLNNQKVNEKQIKIPSDKENSIRKNNGNTESKLPKRKFQSEIQINTKDNIYRKKLKSDDIERNEDNIALKKYNKIVEKIVNK